MYTGGMNELNITCYEEISTIQPAVQRLVGLTKINIGGSSWLR